MNAHLGGFRAVGLGIRALRRNGGLWGFGLGSEAVLAACRSALFIAFALAFAARFAYALDHSDAGDVGSALDGALGHTFSGALGWPLFGSWLVLELMGALARTIYLSAAVVEGSATLADPSHMPRPVLTSALGVFPRAVAATIWTALIELVAGLSRIVLWGSTWLIVTAALAQHHRGGYAAFIGALGLTLGMFLQFIVVLFGRVYRVQALRRLELTALAAAWEAGASLRARLPTYVLIVAIGAGLQIGGAMMVSGVAAGMGAATQGHLVLGQIVQVLSAVAIAMWASAVELALVGGFSAVDLDQRGELPKPPEPPAPVVLDAVAVAEVVLVAQAIDPEPGPVS